MTCKPAAEVTYLELATSGHSIQVIGRRKLNDGQRVRAREDQPGILDRWYS